MSLEGHKGASLVLAHQPTIAGHVSSKYCGESSFHRTPPRFRRGRISRPLIVLSFSPAGYRFAGSVTASSLFGVLPLGQALSNESSATFLTSYPKSTSGA